jgi:D-3-phosphoglycerate dehydrogenase
VISAITAAIGVMGINIENMASKSKGEQAYTILDLTGGTPGSAVADRLKAQKDIIRVRMLEAQ